MINEIGNKYGRLTVLQPDRSKGKLKWLCSCECGKTVIVDGADLRRGHTTSCGCYQKQQTSKASVIDYTNKIIGQMQVLQRDFNYYGKGVKTHWFCKCLQCGDIVSVSSDRLKQQPQSCGCIKSKGEFKINKILLDNNIHFKKEFTFKDVPNRRFDFAILDEKNEPVRLIEYDGIQHYYVSKTWGWTKNMSLEQQQKRDLEKNLIAKKHNVELCRIPYWKLEKITIKELLDNTFLIL